MQYLMNPLKKNSNICARLILAVLVVSALSACTMVSKKMLPGMEYRENPHVEIIEYEDRAKLQEDCAKQSKETGGWYWGCSLIPHDPQGTCIVRVMAGDERIKKHELAHCHGQADTIWPWMTDHDFYRSQKKRP